MSNDTHVVVSQIANKNCSLYPQNGLLPVQSFFRSELCAKASTLLFPVVTLVIMYNKKYYRIKSGTQRIINLYKSAQLHSNSRISWSKKALIQKHEAVASWFDKRRLYGG